jgi:hypothetical protein
VKIETVPQRVARATLQLDETGINGSSFHAQTGRIRHNERGLGLVQIPPRAQTPGVESFLGNSLLRAAALSLHIYLTWVEGRRASRLCLYMRQGVLIV